MKNSVEDIRMAIVHTDSARFHILLLDIVPHIDSNTQSHGHWYKLALIVKTRMQLLDVRLSGAKQLHRVKQK